MKYFLILLPLLSTQVFAKEFNLKCVATYNSNEAFDVNVKLSEKQPTLCFGILRGIEYYLNYKGNDVIEIEAVDYAYDDVITSSSAKFTNSSSFVKHDIRKTNFLMKLKCSALDLNL